MAHKDEVFGMNKAEDAHLLDGSGWVETRDDYPLPVFWFVDDPEHGTIYRAKTMALAAKRASLLMPYYEGPLTLRCYAPSKEQWERDLQYSRERRHWEQGFSGPSRSWQEHDRDGVIRAN